MNYVLGTLVVGVMLALLGREWTTLRRQRANPGESPLPYSFGVFCRRAAVSFLILGLVALYANQDLVLNQEMAIWAKRLYMGGYVVCLVALYVLILVDFRYSRRVAREAAKLLIREQRDYVGALLKLAQSMESGPGGRPSEDSMPIPSPFAQDGGDGSEHSRQAGLAATNKPDFRM